jgi:hypothetical protein
MFRSLHPRAARRALRALAASAALGVVACDVPTSAPIIEQRWVLPADGTVLAVDRFLPPGVTTQGTSFAISLPGATLSQSLGELCSVCAGQLTVPKPAFQADLFATVDLPTDVTSAALAGGTVLLEIENGFGFDPLRPSSSGARGRLVSTITSGTTVVAADTVSGEGYALAPGTTLSRAIQIAAVTVNGPLAVHVWLDSPAGDRTTVDASQRIVVRATPKSWRVASARVALRDKSGSATDIALDLGGVDESLAERVTGGALRLVITNPLNASGQFTVTLSAPGIAPIDKPLALTANATAAEQRLVFTASELRSILGRDDVTLTVHGAVSGADAGQTVVVTPSAAIAITSTLELTLRTETN